MTGHTATPGTSLATVCAWFEMAAENAERDGRSQSAMLWRDGLANLIYLSSQRDQLVIALIALKDEAVTSVEYSDWPELQAAVEQAELALTAASA